MEKEFLFEVLSEEIPANLQGYGANHLCELFEKYGAEIGISIMDYKKFYSSQRIAILCELKIEKKEVVKHIRGPKLGVSAEILQRFLSSNENGQQIEIDGKYHGIEVREIFNKNDVEIERNLGQLCKKVLENFMWNDKVMTWKSYLPAWVRPIRSILCMLDEKVIDFEFVEVKSSNQTFGHKILTRWKKFDIEKIENYELKLKENFVIVNQEKRKNIILKNLRNVDLNDKNISDLMNELICIAEYPQVMECNIEEKFLSLPEDLIKHIMISHQRYIPRVENNILMDVYYVVIDHNNPNEIMKKGYERVLDARLSDGRFYWDKFVNTTLQTLIEKSKGIKSEYNSDLSIYDFNFEVSKIFENSEEIHGVLNTLSCDLSSDLIVEYPSLRGLMACEYIIRNKIKISEKYFAGVINNNLYSGESEIYHKNVDYRLSDFEKAVVFGKNLLKAKHFIIDKKEKPTSSRDPFQVRKSIENSVESFVQSYFVKDGESDFETISHRYIMIGENDIFKQIFFDVLLNFYYRANENFSGNSKIVETGFYFFVKKHDLVFNYFNIKDFIFRQLDFIESLCNFKWRFETIEAYKRVAQLCSKKYKDFNLSDYIDESLVKENEEKDFVNLIKTCENEISFKKLEDYEFQGDIIKVINNFFDRVRIEDSDEKIRNNRISMIVKFYRLVENFAPISEIFY